MVRFLPDENNPLSCYHGCIGEVLDYSDRRLTIRINLEGHDTMYPSQAIIHTDWDKVRCV